MRDRKCEKKRDQGGTGSKRGGTDNRDMGGVEEGTRRREGWKEDIKGDGKMGREGRENSRMGRLRKKSGGEETRCCQGDGRRDQWQGGREIREMGVVGRIPRLADSFVPFVFCSPFAKICALLFRLNCSREPTVYLYNMPVPIA